MGCIPQILLFLVLLGFFFYSLCYIILLYFCSVLLLVSSGPLNVFSLEMVCTVLREDLGRDSSCNAKKAGRLYLVALCDFPSLCSQRPLYAVTLLRGVYLRNLGGHTDLSLWVDLGCLCEIEYMYVGKNREK